MASISIANIAKPVAVALDWHVLPGHTSERKEIDGFSKSAGLKIGVTLTDEVTGVTILGLSSEKSQGIACGAAWLAKASGRDTVVLVEPLEDGRLWLCAVRAGLPVQGLDIVIDAVDLQQRLPEFLQDNNDRICSTLENLDSFGYINVIPQSFAELVANTKQEKLTRVSGMSPVLVYGSVATAVALLGWLGGSAYLDQLAQQRNAQASAANARKMQANAAELARKAQALRRVQAENILKGAVLGQPTVAAEMKALFASIESLPTSVAGWGISTLDCEPKMCLVTWNRTPVGTVAGFVQAAETNGWLLMGVAGDSASTGFSLDADSRVANVDDIVVAPIFRAAFETKLQQMQLAGLKYTFPASQSVEASLPAPPMTPGAPTPAAGASAPAVTLPWRIGTATVKGGNLFALRGTPDYLEHPAVAIKRAAVDLKSNEWTLEVTYATR
jgi:hypothetical protein